MSSPHFHSWLRRKILLTVIEEQLTRAAI